LQGPLDTIGSMPRAPDSLLLPTGESPTEVFARALPLAGTAGEAYVQRRHIPLAVAHQAGVRYCPDYAGRPAVLAALYDRQGALASLHGRYLEVTRDQNKMLTIGPGGGTFNVLGGWLRDPLIVVEGVFDALSLAACGWPCCGTIGRWVPWLPSIAEARNVWLAFDNARSADTEAVRYSRQMSTATRVARLRPPGHSKDWNTALVKRRPAAIQYWLEQHCKQLETK